VRPRHHAPESEDHGIDLAPMLDFVLNLLIFFIITTSFVKDPGVNVARGEAETAEHRDNGNLLVAIRENNEIWVDRRRLDLRELRAVLERMHIERPDDSAVIVADRASQAGMVAQVMDEIQAAGIKEVAIAAMPTGGR
jgi:biopolymer transport protein ExbD